MSKFTITINDDDANIIQQYIKGPMYHEAFSEIQQRVFRPARKHGYLENDIKEMITDIDKGETDGIENDGRSQDLIEALEALFLEVLDNYNVELG